MNVQRFGSLGLALGLAISLSACVEGKGPFGNARSDAAKSDAATADGAPDTILPPGDMPATERLSDAVRLVERDVEAPNTFSLSDKALWDGRPSLGGVWVAHGSVKDPERVMIRNPSNGKFVVGALFRREFANPGPSIQVSSDAADALGMLAGQPAELSVVALKREELPKGGVPANPDVPAAAMAAGEPVTGDKAGSDDPAALGAAAVAAVTPGSTRPAPKPADTKVGDAAAAGMATPAAETPATTTPVKKKFCLFGKCRKQAAADAALADAGQPMTATSAAPGAIAATPLAPVGTAKGAAAATTAKPAAVLNRAYLQVGIFSLQANAEKAAAQMKGAGLSATVKADQVSGKPFWRVIVGPVATEAERNAYAARVKGLGYPDAYPVTK